MNKNHIHILCVFLLSAGCLGQKKTNETPSTMIDASYPYEVKKISLSPDVEVAYMDEGKGDYTLVMLHGLGSYAPAWNKNLPVLKEYARCIALDLPNYGLSRPGDYTFSMTFFAETVEALIRKLELKKVVLMGHSMGGQIATMVVLRNQVPVEKLILVAPAGFETFTEQDRAWIRTIFTADVIKASTEEILQRNFNLNFATNQLPSDAAFMYDDRLKMKSDSAAYESYAQMIPKCVKGMLDEPVFDRLSDIGIPTLVIFGKEDFLIPNRLLHPTQTPQSVAETGRQQIPNSTLHLLSPCGHFLQWECAGMVNSVVLEFLGN